MSRALAALAGVLALAAWVATADVFRVGGPLQGPLVVAAGPQSWARGCWGATYEEVAVDAQWTRCLGVPHGPRRCLGYPALPDSHAGTAPALPLGPLREIPCPER